MNMDRNRNAFRVPQDRFMRRDDLTLEHRPIEENFMIESKKAFTEDLLDGVEIDLFRVLMKQHPSQDAIGKDHLLVGVDGKDAHIHDV